MEDSLVNGANIYIQKPTDIQTFKTLLYRDITTNHQYDGQSLSKENFNDIYDGTRETKSGDF